MAKNNRVFLLMLVIINICYFGFIGITKILNNQTSNLPVISFKSDSLTISVNDDLKVLLKGVTAIDEEDGDISKNIFIYDISMFDENNERMVTYGVFDSDNQMTIESRKFKYKDYTSPKFSSSKPLSGLMSMIDLSTGSSQETGSIQAFSSVDGDISNKISKTQSESGDSVICVYSVTDSTGTTETLTVSESLNLKELFTNISIELNDYIVYVKKGSTVDYRSYIHNVKTSIGYQKDLIDSVTVESNLNVNKPGVYEVVYTLNRSNGDYGTTKMYVIVEG